MEERVSAGPNGTWQFDGFCVRLIAPLSPAREGWERALFEEGRALALPHRAAWAKLHPAAARGGFLAVSDSSGQPCGAVALESSHSRSLPGHLIIRCQRFGPGLPARAHRAALQAMVAITRERLRVLRLHVETFAIDDAERAALERHARDIGFSRVVPSRSYEHTLVVSLEHDEEAIFASLHATARRHIRAVAKNPVRIGLVDDPGYFPRLDELSRETYARTGGTYDPPDWSKVAALGAADPAGSRVTGLYRTDVDGPAALLAFAWGCAHGDHVHYSRAASTRDTDLRMPLMYPIVWDLMRWAKRGGAQHFDFGGITLGTHQSNDPLGGISDFKRYFSGRVVEVGAEWSLEPRAFQARAARLVSAGSSIVSRVSRVVARSRLAAPVAPGAASDR